jgi:hypothetical protein
MQLRHISPRSAEWLDAVYDGGGGRGWQQKLASDDKAKLRHEGNAPPGSDSVFARADDDSGQTPLPDYGLAAESVSR